MLYGARHGGFGYGLVATAANDMLLRNEAPVPGKDERKT
jgi:hypothetical protein